MAKRKASGQLKRSGIKKRKVDTYNSVLKKNKRNMKKVVQNTLICRQFILPDCYVTKLKYVETIVGNTVSPATADTYQFRLNSIFDPNFSGTGHQPMGHDQLIELYNKYHVYGVNVKHTVINYATNPIKFVAFNQHAQSVNTVSIDHNVEKANENLIIITGAGSGRNTFVYNRYADLAAFSGLDRDSYFDTEAFGAVVGANPDDVIYHTWHALDPKLATHNYTVTTELTMYVRFTDRKTKQLAQS